jgi:DNA repair protein RadA/Sms
MHRARTVHRCQACDATAPRWTGRCPTCGEWNSLVEETVRPTPTAAAGGEARPAPVPLASVDAVGAAPRPTGLAELDRVLGGGLVPGSVTLVGGEPGVGKSTLLLQVLAAEARRGPVLLAAAEESARQVRLRAERLGGLSDQLLVLAGTDLGAVVDAVAAVQPGLVVVDSIQSVSDPDVPGIPGTLAQVRSCAEVLTTLAKASHVPFILVSHVTKEGSLAGPRALEHLVDTVVLVEGDRHHALRMLNAVKHRFGPTGELGLFEMSADGLHPVADPHRYLLGDRRGGVAGSVVLPAMQGQRALLVEVQALMAPTRANTQPRSSAQGLDASRLALVRAVLDRRAHVGKGPVDLFASVVGGIRVVEPAADLALACALASAWCQVPIADDVVVFGEVGLGGEVRQAPQAGRRLAEAHRVGFRRAVVPSATPDGPPGLEVVRVTTVLEALSLLIDVDEVGRRAHADDVFGAFDELDPPDEQAEAFAIAREMGHARDARRARLARSAG